MSSIGPRRAKLGTQLQRGPGSLDRRSQQRAIHQVSIGAGVQTPTESLDPASVLQGVEGSDGVCRALGLREG